VVLVETDISEEHIASIFRVRDSGPPWFALRRYLLYDGLIITVDEATAYQLYLHGIR
jgi:hypothetical protein